MRCPYCKKHIPVNADSCPHCNTPLPKSQEPVELSVEDYEAPVSWKIQDSFAFLALGLTGLSGGLLAPVGLVFAGLSLKRKQKHRWISFWSLGLSIFFLALWLVILMIFLANR